VTPRRRGWSTDLSQTAVASCSIQGVSRVFHCGQSGKPEGPKADSGGRVVGEGAETPPH